MRRTAAALILLIAIFANARHITLDEAQSVASEFFSNGTSSASPNRIRPLRAPSSDSTIAQPYYVFNVDGDNGFVIISGDDRVKKILGYSDKGSFDFSNMPPQLQGLLDQYAEMINALPETEPTDPSWSAPAKTPTESEGILLETANWGQNYPFNTECPIIDGVQAPTGCVATAMGIVMEYHKWPKKGRRKIYYSNNKDEYLDCSDLIIPWETISNTDGIVDEDTRYKEISNLLYYCGRSTRTTYGIASSSAPNFIIVPAMRRYFSYNTSIKRIERQYYNDDQWISIIQNEIDNNRPILYEGVDPFIHAGHSFVVDGYNTEGLFHINWGWNGSDNGYFNLDFLWINNFCFDNCQAAVIGIAPSDDYDMTWSDFYLIDEKEDYHIHSEPYPHDFQVSVEELKKGEYFDVVTPTISAPPSLDESFKIGIALVDENQNIKEIVGYEYYLYGENIAPKGYDGDFKRCMLKTSDIDSSDLLYLATFEPSDNIWKLIKTQPNLPSFCSIQNLHGDFSHLTFEADDPLKFHIVEGMHNYDLSKEEISFLKNSKASIEARRGTSNIGSAIIINDQRGSTSGSVYMTFYEDNYHFKGIAHPLNQNISLQIFNPSFGGLESIIEKEKVIHCDNLMINGKIDETDISYLSNYMLFANSVCFNCEIKNSTIPAWAFHSLDYLRELSLPEGLENIETSAFVYCELKQVFLPSTIKRLGDGCFWIGPRPIEAIYLKAEEPPLLDGNGVFYEPHETMLYVPKGCVDKYRSLPQWNVFKDIREIPNIALNETDCTLYEGDNVQLEVVVMPVHSQYLQWTSSDEAVATVDQDGLVTAISPGTAVITNKSTDGSGMEAQCIITVLPFVIGDSNYDGVVTVTDAVNTANYAVGNEVRDFFFRFADVNQDEKITLSDAAGTIKIVLSQSYINDTALCAPSRESDNAPAFIAISDYTATEGETAQIGIRLHSDINLVAMQGDLRVPEGSEIIGITAGTGAEGHSISTHSIDNRTMRVVLFDPNNSTFDGNDEVLLNLEVKVNAVNPGVITMSNIFSSDTDANEYRLVATGGVNKAAESGIAVVDGDGNISISTLGNAIVIENACGKQVVVHNINGSVVADFEAHSNLVKYEVTNGFYFVKIADKVEKVIIK